MITDPDASDRGGAETLRRYELNDAYDDEEFAADEQWCNFLDEIQQLHLVNAQQQVLKLERTRNSRRGPHEGG